MQSQAMTPFTPNTFFAVPFNLRFSVLNPQFLILGALSRYSVLITALLPVQALALCKVKQ